MLNADATPQGRVRPLPRSRNRMSTSCTECRRRKQKCNQSRDRPCNNCARRYPPVACTYASSSKLPKQNDVIELEVSGLGVEDAETPQSESASSVSTKFNPYESSILSFEDRPFAPHGDPYAAQTPSQSAVAPDIKFKIKATEQGCLIDHDVKQHPSSFGHALQAYKFKEEEDHDGSGFEMATHTFHLDYQPQYRIMDMHVGSMAVEPLHSLPMEASMRNAELMYLFLKGLSPFMTSIDGRDPSHSFNGQWLPFMTQSPLSSHLTLVTASYYQAAIRGIPLEKSIDAMATRVKLITLINEYISSNRKMVNDDVIAAVMSFAYNEWVYCDRKPVIAHMKGLREMIRVRGGIDTIERPTLRKLLVRTDYHIAAVYECETYLHDKAHNEMIPVLSSYRPEHDSPFILSKARFVDFADSLAINVKTAMILDDMRFLTTSVISMSKDGSSMQENAKFFSTALWIYNQLSTPQLFVDPSLANDFIHQTCQTAAIIYSGAILSRTPISVTCNAQLLDQLWMSVCRVPLSQWKRIPGIFSWVMSVPSPFARDKPQGRFFKGMMSTVTVSIGLVDWDLASASLKGFFAVQGWLAGGNERRSMSTSSQRLELPAIAVIRRATSSRSSTSERDV